MKVYIYGGEAFPVYTINMNMDYIKDDSSIIDVDVETLKRWKEVSLAFEKMQSEIINFLKDQGKGNQVWNEGMAFNPFDENIEV